MKALLDHIPASERLCIIEQPAELQVLQPNAIRWEAVEAIPGQVRRCSKFPSRALF
jgi:pilus assembly protein CpaF